ncbi:hypothetical protein PFLmoz3_03356 [Pseudomonas fluorescens]|uniref:Uncharacterized protein n=1 Tax=Pseudomonas fluorescens TaxID=294 RepID=A0A120G786_PSEFL|nr:hypothetical protein PFLmoz3_03356 [Pseudomonas fluorescens]
MLELARHPALDDGGVVVGVAQGFGEALADLFHARRVVANRVAVGVEHDVGVEGELAAGGDDPGVMDVQVELVHGRHGHGEEVVLVGRVNEDLRAAFEFALGGFLDQDQRAAIGGLLQDCVTVPGHVAGGVAQEVIITQLRPELLDVVRVVTAAHQDIQGCALGAADLLFAVHRVLQATAQGALGFGVQLAQQAGTPGVPQRGVSGVDIGDGQHIEVVETGLIADDAGKVVNHLWVGQVLALGRGRHHQVVLHQPDNQAAVPQRQLVALAEGFGIHRADLRVVAMPALADVVVQAGQVNQLGLGQLGHQLTGQREFL